MLKKESVFTIACMIALALTIVIADTAGQYLQQHRDGYTVARNK